ncbi:hypothetical protein BUE93_18645 [Chromobacterium amazonense]|uniref:HTH lysR-type domain-containing protein n=1 Tax=Chromobacterium amazonense TaxID=1382803 RepID=A0A2S9X031_9NEIS|nr:LysR family transcriptional regulator [Chromobacterium amazonense]PRP69074.1 hypothetical protein BUE93_18645 [Chromobacterium amazonense]
MEFNETRARYFYEVVRLGSMTAAADHLDIAASAVSRQVAHLENELGIQLLERHKKKLFPTEAGKVLLAYYRNHLAEQQVLLALLRELKGIQRGHVSVVTGGGVITELMASVDSFTKLYPNVTLSIDIQGTDDIMNAVIEDRAHIGILFYSTPNPQLKVHKSSIHPLYAIASRSHPLATSETPIHFADLTQHKLTLPDFTFGVRQILRDAERQEKVHLKPDIISNSFSVMIECAMTGHAITVQPKFAVRRELANGDLIAIPILQNNLMKAELHIITHQGRRLDAAASRLLDSLIKTMPSFCS